jgi:Family of unknown function (DUF6282)
MGSPSLLILQLLLRIWMRVYDAHVEPATDWLVGAIDVHVHAAPSVFPRWGDGPAVADASRAAGMAGVVLKAHEGSTVEAAAALATTHAPLRMAGGVVLNRPVGGLNPAAADTALRLGARVVWLPTLDAGGHAAAYGATGAYPAQAGAREGAPPLPVLDDAGEPRQELLEIIALVRDAGACLATGHVAADAVVAVQRHARRLGLGRLLLQHPLLSAPGFDLDGAVELAAGGGIVELTYLSVSPLWRETTVAACAQVARRLGPDMVLLASDAGQRHNPSPPEALRAFAQSVHEAGVPVTDVLTMLRETPAGLLGW